MHILPAFVLLAKSHTVNKYTPIAISCKYIYPIDDSKSYKIQLALVLYAVFPAHASKIKTVALFANI
jgi:hypothetical protein